MRKGRLTELVFWPQFHRGRQHRDRIENTRKFANGLIGWAAPEPPPMQFINVSVKFSIPWQERLQFFQLTSMKNRPSPAEPRPPAQNPGQLGTIASRGKAFNRTPSQKKMLRKSWAVGNATARTIALQARHEGGFPESGQTHGSFPFRGRELQFLSQPARNLASRVLYSYNYTGVTPAMAFEMVASARST